MPGNNCNKLVKASDVASSKGVQHILAVLKPGGTLALSASENILNAIQLLTVTILRIHVTDSER